MSAAQGLLIVVSGPAAVGKGTMCEMLLKRRPDIELSISATTRAPRGTERDGVEYFFVSNAEFAKMRDNGELLECASVHGRWYGTPRAFVMDKLNAGGHVLLEIDVQGARAVKLSFPGAVTAFVLPPNWATLKGRLNNRGTENEQQRAIRLNTALRELHEVGNYDYAIVNDELLAAVDALEGVIDSEMRRVSRGLYKGLSIMDEIKDLGGDEL